MLKNYYSYEKNLLKQLYRDLELSTQSSSNSAQEIIFRSAREKNQDKMRSAASGINHFKPHFWNNSKSRADEQIKELEPSGSYHFGCSPSSSGE